jgi:hypothetical protein
MSLPTLVLIGAWHLLLAAAPLPAGLLLEICCGVSGCHDVDLSALAVHQKDTRTPLQWLTGWPDACCWPRIPHGQTTVQSDALRKRF